MGWLSNYYTKPGRGIDPDAPKKRAFFRFFETFGLRFWKLVKLNMISILAMLPTAIILLVLSGFVANRLAYNLADGNMQVAIPYAAILRVMVVYFFTVLWGTGPATAGLAHILRNFSRDEHAWLWSDFKDGVKSNFKQSTLVFLIDVLAMFILFFGYNVYSSYGGFTGYLRYAILLVVIVYTLMHLYIYPLMVTFELSLKEIYKNAMIFAMAKLPTNILILASVIGIHALAIYGLAVGGTIAVVGVTVLEVSLLGVFTSFIVSFNANEKFSKYMEKQD